MNSGFSLHFLLQTSELKGGKLREVVANHKHLHLPRLSSRSLFDELCPEERFRSQRRLVIYSQLIKRILKPWSKCCSSTKKLLLTISNSVTDLKGPGPPLIFRPKWGRKGIFGDCPPLSQGLDDPPSPLSEGLHLPLCSGSVLNCLSFVLGYVLFCLLSKATKQRRSLYSDY